MKHKWVTVDLGKTIECRVELYFEDATHEQQQALARAILAAALEVAQPSTHSLKAPALSDSLSLNSAAARLRR